MIVLPDIYLEKHFKSQGKVRRWVRRLMSLLMIIFTLALASSKDFAPKDMTWLNCYLFLLGIIVVPKLLFALCSLIGLGVRRLTKSRMNWGNLAGTILAIAALYIVIYGSTIGFRKLDIRHVDYYSADLPESFDGYKMVHFSDLHLGTYIGGREYIAEKAVDSINAVGADVILFTGDIQNMEPSEIYPFIDKLSTLKAKDGVFAVLGNHDYSMYIDTDEATKVANERELVMREKSMGWTLLLNDHRAITRGSDSIFIAGEENDGDGKHFPRKGNLKKTFGELGQKDGKKMHKMPFTVLLEHDPTAWRRSILPESDAQLTLSGHTHAMQFMIFGWSPCALVYDEWGGMYYDGDRALNVSVGVGGFVPFRFGATGEICVITLHKKVKK